jgi:hypothetical protein
VRPAVLASNRLAEVEGRFFVALPLDAGFPIGGSARVDETRKRWLREAGYGEKDAKLVDDFSASGETCAKAVTAAFAKASIKRDVNERRKALGALLGLIRAKKIFL